MATQAVKSLFVLAFVALVTVQVSAKVFYVKSPQDKIQDCVDSLKEPGDECFIQPGSYHEHVTITNKHGSEGNPIVIRGHPQDQTKLDGTVLLKPVDGKWEKMANGAYKAEIAQHIWQLFIDDEMMTNARWPNSLWSDKTIFHNQHWAHSSRSSTRGLMIDGGKHKLAESGLDATGAMAVLNVGSFCTFTRKVLKHNKETADRFTYKDDFGATLNFKPKNNQYFLEDKLEFLDNPGEWFYDKTSKTLYVMTPDGGSPQGRDIRGKVQTLAFTITDSTHVLIKDLTFFATTLDARSNIDKLELNSLNFRFPTYSRRMLQETTPPQWTKVFAGKGSVRIYNNTFYGTDGIALEYEGVNDTVENNFFEYNDWSGANMVTAQGGAGTVVSQSRGDKFIRNTLRYNGASVGYRSGYASQAKLNDISRTCWGMLQHDGAGIQSQVKRQTGIVMEQNWVHNSPKYGLRFDGGPPNIGFHGTMRRNVIRKTNGMMVKGDKHTVDHNLVFHKFTKAGDHDGQGSKCNLCVLRYVRQNPIAINHNTKVEYNAADIANGGVHNKKLYPMSGKLVGNVIGDVRKQLMDPDNMDFRPRPGSSYIEHNVGPYNFEETKTKYWIPGRLQYKASNPVPPDGATKVKAASRDVLMWLNSFNGKVHILYLGTKRDSLRHQGVARNGKNVLKLRKALENGKEYFWRVDARVNTKLTYKGDVWSFKTI